MELRSHRMDLATSEKCSSLRGHFATHDAGNETVANLAAPAAYSPSTLEDLPPSVLRTYTMDQPATEATVCMPPNVDSANAVDRRDRTDPPRGVLFTHRPDAGSLRTAACDDAPISEIKLALKPKVHGRRRVDRHQRQRARFRLMCACGCPILRKSLTGDPRTRRS